MQSEHLPVCKDRPWHSQDQDLEGCHSLPLQRGQNWIYRTVTQVSLHCDTMQWVSDYICFIHCFLHFSSGRGYCKWFYYYCTNCPMTLIYNACCMEYKCSYLQADAEAFIVHKVLLLCYLPAMILTYCSDEEGISTLITAWMAPDLPGRGAAAVSACIMRTRIHAVATEYSND